MQVFTIVIANHKSEIVNRMAEGVGFEPTLAFTKHVFKTCAFSRSAIPPKPLLEGRMRFYHNIALIYLIPFFFTFC